MTINAYSTMGGTADAIGYPLEDEHPITNLAEVETAFDYAAEALDAAERLEQAALDYDGMNETSARLLNVAVETYLEKFKIPRAALEAYDLVPYDPAAAQSGGADSDSGQPSSSGSAGEDDDDEPSQGPSRLKKAAKLLYALVERVFKAIFDFFTNQKVVARKLIPLSKKYIGESDSLSAQMASQLRIKDRNLMLALHIEGQAPRKAAELFDELATAFEKQHAYSAVTEVIRVVSSVREKNSERIVKEANTLRNKLEDGMKAALNGVNPSTIPVFTEKKSDRVRYYASKPLFGQHYIVGLVGNEVSPAGSFRFNCSVRRDSETPLRATAFPVLTPEEIRQICRTALKVCENVVRFSRDEELMKKALREATYLNSKETDQASVAALRNVAAVGQNSYIVHLRFVTRTTQALMRWCAQSIARYEEVRQNG